MKSIVKLLRNRMYLFGIAMGFIFPVYAHFFVHWKEGMFFFFLLGAIAAGVTVGVVNYILVDRILIRQISRITDLSDRLAGGDIFSRLNLNSQDQVGEIAIHFNSFLDQNQLHIKGVQEQVNHISESIASLEIMGESFEMTVSEHNEHSLPASVNKLNSIVAEGVDIVSTINSAQQAGSIVSAEMNHLSQAIQEMSDTLQTIDTIAMKSRILSLNASVEAARLGTMGSTFAVVADEMGKLSEDTGRLSHLLIDTIEQLLSHFTSVQSSLSTLDDAVEHSRDSLQSACLRFSDVGQAIQKASELLSETGFSMVASVEKMTNVRSELEKVLTWYKME